MREFDCGAMYSRNKHTCGRRAVLWHRHEVKSGRSFDFWKCGCGAELPRSWSKVKGGRRS